MFGIFMPQGGSTISNTAQTGTSQQGGFGQFMSDPRNQAMLARLGADLMAPRRKGTTAGNVASAVAAGMTELNQRKAEDANLKREQAIEDRNYELNNRRVKAEEGRADLAAKRDKREEDQYNSEESKNARAAATDLKKAQAEYYREKDKAAKTGQVPATLQITDRVADYLVRTGKYKDPKDAFGEAWTIANKNKDKPPQALVHEIALKAYETTLEMTEDTEQAKAAYEKVSKEMEGTIGTAGTMPVMNAEPSQPTADPRVAKLKAAIDAAGGWEAYRSQMLGNLGGAMNPAAMQQIVQIEQFAKQGGIIP